MNWSVGFHPEFRQEVLQLPSAVRVELIASMAPLGRRGPSLGRPDVDTLNDSRYANMKELRFRATVAFGGLLSRSILSAMRFCL